MCLAIPVKIIKIDGNTATVDAGGVQRAANLGLLENIKVGDYVLMHAGFAIQTMSKKEAEESLKVWEEINKLNN